MESERSQSPPRAERDIYSVSRLNREVRVLLERGFGSLWVEAEISNFARPASGHWYFSLEGRAARRCAARCSGSATCCAASRRGDGQKVLVRARVGLYEPRGEFQLSSITWRMRASAPCSAQFEELSARLAAEGLFAAERKRPLPRPAAAHRRHHLAHRGGHARHPARARAALSGRARC